MSIDFKELANRYGTPLYVYDFDAMKENYRALKDAFAGQIPKLYLLVVVIQE